MAIKPSILTFQAVIRFVQGYRYLDVAGETLIKLEQILDKYWIPGEIKPSGGLMKNFALGMNLEFSSEAMQVEQRNFISFKHFRDQAGRIYETLWKQFQIERINSPNLKIVFQFPTKSADESASRISKMALFDFDPSLLAAMGGEQSASSAVVCTEQDVDGMKQRRRIDVSPISQVQQMDVDARLVHRTSLLSLRTKEAMDELRRIRSALPAYSENAVQIQMDNAYEGEISVKSFDFSDFLDRSKEWSERVNDLIGERLNR